MPVFMLTSLLFMLLSKPSYLFLCRCSHTCIPLEACSAAFHPIRGHDELHMNLLLQQNRLPVCTAYHVTGSVKLPALSVSQCALSQLVTCFVHSRVFVRTFCSFSDEDTEANSRNNKLFMVSHVRLPAVWRKFSVWDGVGSDTGGKGEYMEDTNIGSLKYFCF